ncbi:MULTISPECIES: hypothetical protein [Streptacidiphilus]|uniref:Uncharacterized protein n=1 Tax=Streptacidiphilus cavernicola TaxID=3342716 RepID=A0ABV6UX90_9ACTN|nr:hypothetical protein [Streptacidiphilus jeojiense]
MRVLLCFVYFLLVVPAGVASRLIRDPLARRWDPRAETYWVTSGGNAVGGRAAR